MPAPEAHVEPAAIDEAIGQQYSPLGGETVEPLVSQGPLGDADEGEAVPAGGGGSEETWPRAYGASQPLAPVAATNPALEEHEHDAASEEAAPRAYSSRHPIVAPTPAVEPGDDREDQEISMLAMHLLQSALVLINTMLVQQVLAEPRWSGRLGERDRKALTPLFWNHVNPYGKFTLDMHTHLDLGPAGNARAA